MGVGFGAGKKLVGGGNKEEGQQEANPSFTDKVQERGKQAASAGAAYAQAQQASQQQMEQRGQQMADKAKAGSQINTGEAMDMSWRLLKDVYFGGEFQNPQYAQARQQIIDAAIENMQETPPVFQPADHAKIGAGFVDDISNLASKTFAGAYRDTKGRVVQPRFPADYMYDQEHSDPKNFPGMQNIPAHHLLNAVSNFVDYEALPRYGSGDLANRALVPGLFERRQSGSHSKRLKNYNAMLQETRGQFAGNTLPNLRTTLSENMKGEGEGATTVFPRQIMRRNLGRGENMLEATQAMRVKDEEKRRLREEEQQKKEDAAKQTEIEAGRKNADVVRQEIKDASKKKAKATREETKRQNIEANIRDIKLSTEETKQEREGFLDTDEGKMMASRFGTFPGAGVHTFDNQMITNPTNMLSVFEQAVYNQLIKRGHFKKSLPMDMAWRMLKGELQLPHQITEALRGDLTTLDRAHKMTDTNEGTLIEGIHPDMENVVKLLAEKHMGDLAPTMQRPVMPLFHSPFH